MNKRVKEICKEQDALETELLKIQKSCRNKHVEKEPHGDTGNFDPSNDRYYTDFHCLDCDKFWTSDD